MKLHAFVVLALAAAPVLTTTPLAQTSKPATPGQKGATAKAPAAPGGVRTIEIVGTDQMKYDKNEIAAKRGEQLRIRLISKGTMPKIAMAHNWVLLGIKTNVPKFINAGAQARATDFIAPEMKKEVIAATALAGAGETVEVTFKVPSVAGKYPYVCTFPGHFQAGMNGTLAVK
jgi:azurin